VWLSGERSVCGATGAPVTGPAYAQRDRRRLSRTLGLACALFQLDRRRPRRSAGPPDRDTGGNSGIGLAAARVLAGAGALVIIAVRDQAKGQRAASEIGDDTEVRALDLADLNSVRAFAAETIEPIDVLINNAGVMAPPLSRTVQGFETQFGSTTSATLR